MLSVNLPVLVFHRLEQVLTWDNLEQRRGKKINNCFIKRLNGFWHSIWYIAFWILLCSQISSNSSKALWDFKKFFSLKLSTEEKIICLEENLNDPSKKLPSVNWSCSSCWKELCLQPSRVRIAADSSTGPAAFLCFTHHWSGHYISSEIRLMSLECTTGFSFG